MVRTATTTAGLIEAPSGSVVFDVEPAVIAAAHQHGVVEDLIIVVDAQDPEPPAGDE